MANEENLKPYTKGDPRAVAGGKKSKRGRAIKSIIDDIMAIPADDLIHMKPEFKKKLPKELQNMTTEEMIWYRTTIQAMGGDKDARRDITDRAHGKVINSIKIDSGIDIPTFQEIAAKEIKDREE